MSACVVIPSNREIAQEQLDLIGDYSIIVVDGGGAVVPPDDRVTVLGMEMQRKWLGDDLELVGHGSAACRNAGVLWAWHAGYDPIINLDDDCWPVGGSLVADYCSILAGEREMTRLGGNDGWVSTLHTLPGEPQWYPRGFPYEERIEHRQFEYETERIASLAHMGLWLGDLDLNAVDKVAYGRSEPLALDTRLFVTSDFLCVCAMNSATTRDFAPFTYQIPWTAFERTCGLGRYDDIIGGLMSVAVARMEGGYLGFGPPLVEHRKKDVDLLTHAAHENYGNVLVSRFAEALRFAFHDANDDAPSRLLRAVSLLDAMSDNEYDYSTLPLMLYVASMYRRWLGLFS